MSDMINIEELVSRINNHIDDVELVGSFDSVDEVCEYCNGTNRRLIEGKVVRCVHCAESVDKTANGDSDAGNSKNKELILKSIPAKYVSKTFIPELITPPENSKNFDSYINALTDIYSRILSGEVLSRSAYVFSFQGLGKQHWVYASMQACLDNGLSVSPYLDSKEVISLFRKDELPNDYFLNDYTFVKMATGLIDMNDISMMRLILDRRARNNRPTIVVSRYSRKYLLKIDKTLEGSFIKNGSGDLENSFYEYSRLLYIPAIGNSDK